MLALTTSICNRVPYNSELDYDFLSPSDLLHPWCLVPPSPIPVPSSSANLRLLQLKVTDGFNRALESQNTILMNEIPKLNPATFPIKKKGFISGVTHGDVVSFYGDVRVCEKVDKGDALVRFHSRSAVLPIKDLKTIAQGSKSFKMDVEDKGSSNQYFLSFPLEMEDALLYLERTMELIEYIPGIGKKVPVTKLHVTIGLVEFQDEDELKSKFEQFIAALRYEMKLSRGFLIHIHEPKIYEKSLPTR